MSQTLPPWVRSLGTLSPGQEFEVPYFDLVTLAQQPMKVRVGSVEILPGGEEAYWLERKIGDIKAVDGISFTLRQGETLLRGTGLGIRAQHPGQASMGVGDGGRSSVGGVAVVDVLGDGTRIRQTSCMVAKNSAARPEPVRAHNGVRFQPR